MLILLFFMDLRPLLFFTRPFQHSHPSKLFIPAFLQLNSGKLYIDLVPKV